MKKILVSLLVLHGMLSVAHTQTNQDTLKAAVPYSIFPIGGLRWTDGTDTLTKMLGMNFHWYGFPDGNTDTTLPAHHWPDNPGTVTPITDPFYWDAASTSKPTYTDLNSLIQTAAGSNDIRVWMPGTSGLTNEYDYTWNYKKGSDTLNEWKILTTDAANYGDSVLSDLGNAQNDPFVGDGYSVVNPTKSHIYNFYYDFVLFFDSTQLASVGSDSDSLYSLEFWVKPAGGTSYSRRATNIITRTLYKNTLNEASTQPSGHIFHADSLSRWFLGQSHKYKLLRTVLNLREDYSYNSDSTVKVAPQVDVRLRTYKKIPIFVRGLRIRDWRAERLLGGYADVALKSAISQLLSVPANKAFKSWTIENEIIYKEFHSWAYLNNLFVHNGAPPANVLAPDWKGNNLFERVLHDQTQYDLPNIKSGILIHEWTPFGGSGLASTLGRPRF